MKEIKFHLHRVFQGEDRVIGQFVVRGDQISFPTHSDKFHCDMFPEGKMSASTKNRITELLDNKHKTMYLEKVE
jgi:hypothetical protein